MGIGSDEALRVTRHCFAEDHEETSGNSGDITKREAVEKALCFPGDAWQTG